MYFIPLVFSLLTPVQVQAGAICSDAADCASCCMEILQSHAEACKINDCDSSSDVSCIKSCNYKAGQLHRFCHAEQCNGSKAPPYYMPYASSPAEASPKYCPDDVCGARDSQGRVVYRYK